MYGRVFWPILAAVIVLGVAAWIVAVRVFGYEMQAQDYPGSAICGVLLAYFLHLWFLPEEADEEGDAPGE